MPNIYAPMSIDRLDPFAQDHCQCATAQNIMNLVKENK